MLCLFGCAGLVVAGLVSAPSARAACPHGDAPGQIESLTLMRRDAVLEVEDGHAQLTISTRYENRSEGPAELEIGDTYGAGMGAVTGAELRVGSWRRSLALADSVDARTTYTAFRDALSVGGPAAVEATAGGPRVSAVVEMDDDNLDVRTRLAMACSVRTATVTTHAIVSSTPDGAGWRFYVPYAADGIRGLTVYAADGLSAEVLSDGGVLALPVGERIAGPPIDLESEAADAWDPDGDLRVEVRVTPRGGPQVRARGAVVSLRPHAALQAPPGIATALDPGVDPLDVDVAAMTLVHADVDVPPGFAPAPAGLRIVFVIDNSVSVGAAGLQRQRALIAEMLRAAPDDAMWTLVPLGRTGRVRGFQSVRTPALPELALENGSDVLGALARAASLASDVESAEQARVVVLSDLHVRARDAPDLLAAAFSATPVLTHVVSFAPHGAEAAAMGWARQFPDENPLAQSVEATGGILVDADGGDEPLAALAAHLIAPTRIDRPHVMAFGHDVVAEAAFGSVVFPEDIDPHAEPLTMPTMIMAGSGLRVVALLPSTSLRGAAGLTLRGQLWGSTFGAPLVTGPAQERVALAALLSDRALDDVPDAVVLDAAVRLGAVSRMTSLVYASAWRPIGDDGTVGFGTICRCGGSLTTGCGWGRGQHVPRPDTERAAEMLQRLIAADARACGVTRVDVTVEIDEVEILDVRERRGGACVVDKIWAHRLDERAHEDRELWAELLPYASFDVTVDLSGE